MFVLISGRQIGVPKGGAPTWRLHTNLYKVASDASTNNSETMYCADLRFGQVIYKFVSYNIPSFWLISLNGFHFMFLLRDKWKRSITKQGLRCYKKEKIHHGTITKQFSSVITIVIIIIFYSLSLGFLWRTFKSTSSLPKSVRGKI